jgi:CRISPR-associated protein Cas2
VVLQKASPPCAKECHRHTGSTYLLMYVIAIYDVNEKRVGKMLKLCRRHLNWIQNSVFEGEITELGMQELIFEARQIMDVGEDSFILFTSREARWLTKTIVGKERSAVDNFL